MPRSKYRAIRGTGKYNNQPVELDGMRFDSTAEAARWQQLVMLQDAGVISELQFHPRYELLPAYDKPNGEHIRPIYYEGDMQYIENGVVVCEDVKGYETDVYLLKAKMMGYYHPEVELRVVKAR